MNKLILKVRARLRAFAPLSCLWSPRDDVLAGWSRWRWLKSQRAAGRLIDPTVEVRCQGTPEECLHLGQSCAIDRGCILWTGDSGQGTGVIRIAEDVYIGPYTYLGSLHTLAIGRGTLIGSHCYLITANHRFDDRELPIRSQGYQGGDILIGEDVWIGSQVVILPSVRIGSGSVVGAGAVVTKDIPAGEIWAGVPARKIRDR